MEDEVAAVVVDNGSGMVKVRDLTMMRPDLRDPALFFSYAIARFFPFTGNLHRPDSPATTPPARSSPRSSDALVIKV
jgi:hypothetical protein